jgi:heavy metal sensor kinase
MTLFFRSLRVRLGLLYILFTLTSMACLGCFSYWYIGRILASSRQQTMMRREERIVAFINKWPRPDSPIGLNEKLRQLSIAIAETDTIQVHDFTGRLLYSSPAPDIYKADWPDSSCIQPCYAIVRKGGHTLRTLNQVVTLDGQEVRLSIAGAMDEHADVLRMIRNSYLICCPLLLIVSVAGGFVLSHRALQPIHRITSEARTIGIRNLKHRLPVPQTGDELQLLAETWNDLLARLDIAVSRLTQFTSDISHDLRTTITVMFTTAEFALRRTRPDREYREALKTISVECQATSRLLDDLLAAARADMVQQDIEWEPIDLTAISSEACEHMRAKIEIKHQLLELYLCRNAWIKGDISLLRRLLIILLDNAVKYTPDGGTISVTVEKVDDRIKLRVGDTGVGIPPEAISRIFDRFYRVDQSRNQENGSSGLGLAIAKWIVEAHHFTIEVDSTVAVGTTFTVSVQIEPDGFSSNVP